MPSANHATDQAGDEHSEIILRLKRIEGQIRGLQRMVGEGRHCGDILTQLLAVRAGLDQVAVQVFHSQIDDCLSPEGAADPESRRALQESLRLWARLA